MRALLLALGCVSCIATVQAAWTKQLGTVDFPKSLPAARSIRQGDVFDSNGQLFMAKKLGAMADKQKFPEVENEQWLRLQHGTYLWPKQPGDAFQTGDVVKDDGDYKKVLQTSPTILQELDEKTQWMSLLNPLIKDRRLGDLAIPGTHDSGTSGINVDSYIVDKNILFSAGWAVTPMTLVNWSLTHDTDLEQQLSEGYRWFDLRVADLAEEDGTFRWWHGLGADVIEPGLQAIADFASTHPDEIVMCYFQHFAMPGNSLRPTRPIPDDRKQVLSDIILDYLGPFMVSPDNLSTNPTVNEILAEGGNIISFMRDDFILNLDSRYWPNVIHSSWSSRSNPEDLFNERSGKLEDFKDRFSEQMTDISGALTANEKLVVAGIERAYGDWENVTDIIDAIAPDLLEKLDPDEMSFEGLFMDLLLVARDGTNTAGQQVRPAEAYTSGASVHYSGLGEQYRHWLARPDKYKPNIIYVDDSTSGDSIVSLAIEANRGGVKREVTVAVQGSGRHGFYAWEGFRAVGGRDGLNCTPIEVRVEVTSEGLYWDTVHGKVTFIEGDIPPEADVLIRVRSLGGVWRDLFSGNIQDMIDANQDVYVRGNGADVNDVDAMPAGWGFAYVSSAYNVFADDCNSPPADGFLNLVVWEEED